MSLFLSEPGFMTSKAYTSGYIRSILREVVCLLVCAESLNASEFKRCLLYMAHWTYSDEYRSVFLDAVIKSRALTCHQKYIVIYKNAIRYEYINILITRLIEKVDAIPTNETDSDIILDLHIECNHAYRCLILAGRTDLRRQLEIHVAAQRTSRIYAVLNRNGVLSLAGKSVATVQDIEYYTLTPYDTIIQEDVYNMWTSKLKLDLPALIENSPVTN